MPTVAETQWPRDQHGVPLHFLAQINLSDLPAGPWAGSLPKAGALLFFADTILEDHIVPSATLYVERPDLCPPCEPPADCPPIYRDNWHYEVHTVHQASEAPRTFLRRPAVPVLADNVHRVADPDFHIHQMTDTLPLNDHLLCAINGALEAIPAERICQETRIAEQEARLEQLRAELPRGGLGATIVSLFGGRVRRDPALHAKLTRELDRLPAAVKAAKAAVAGIEAAAPALIADLETLRKGLLDSDSYIRVSAPHEETWRAAAARMRSIKVREPSMNNVVRERIMASVAGDRVAFDRLPTVLRTWLDDHWGFKGWLNQTNDHQMFGAGANVQGAGEDFADKVMLAQFVSDQRLGWTWGDLGVLQVWIDPSDLSAHRWDKAFMTFEGH